MQPSVDLTRRAQTLARSTASKEPKGTPSSTRNEPPGCERRADQSLLLLLRGRHLCHAPKPQSAPAVTTMTTMLMPAVAVTMVLVPMLMTTAVIATTVAAVIASAVVPIVAIAVAVVCVATGQKQRYE